MAKWLLITEVKDSGYYIGWGREHKRIHCPEPMQPMSKHSLVQICGSKEGYQVRALTYAHNVFELHEHKSGLKLFDEACFCKTLGEAQAKSVELKKKLANIFDDITKSDSQGKLILRANPMSY